MRVSHGELISNSSIQLTQCKFKGYKKSIKDFRRNLLLKTKCNNKSMRSESSLPFTPREKQSAYVLESTIWSHQKVKARQFSQKSIYTLDHENAESADNQKNYYSKHMQSDKRMDEYLCVVFRKASMDTDKLMKAFQQKMVSSQQKIKSGSSLQSGLMKRLKSNFNKIRIRKQKSKSESSTQNNRISQMNQSHQLMNQLKKTQQFLRSQFIKSNKDSKMKREENKNSNLDIQKKRIKVLKK